MFQALFTRGKERITKAMLEDILKIKIHRLDLDKSKDLLNDTIGGKNGRLDLRAVINDNIECDIEVQLCVHDNFMERFLYYWSKLYSSKLKVGDSYSKLRKTISIIIIDEELEKFKEIEESHTKWQLREEKHREVILTNYCELHILELPKAIKEYENNKEDEILQWMMFLENPENMEVTKIMEENEDIKEAKEELDKLREDDLLFRRALKAELTRMDNEQFLYEAREKGLKEGKKQGVAQGKTEEKLEIAKKLKNKNISIEIIVETTGLSKEEIEKL